MLPSGIYPVPCLGETHYIEVKKNGALHLLDHNIRDEDAVFRITDAEPPGCMSLLYSLRSPHREHHANDYWTESNQIIARRREEHYRVRREDRISYNLRNSLSEWGEPFPFTTRYIMGVLIPAARKTLSACCAIPYAVLLTRHETAAYIVHINTAAPALRVMVGIGWHKVLARGLAVVDGYFVLCLHDETDTYYKVSALDLRDQFVGVHTAFIDKENGHLTWGLTLP